jgi:hypothetical protein
LDEDEDDKDKSLCLSSSETEGTKEEVELYMAQNEEDEHCVVIGEVKADVPRMALGKNPRFCP